MRFLFLAWLMATVGADFGCENQQISGSNPGHSMEFGDEDHSNLPVDTEATDDNGNSGAPEAQPTARDDESLIDNGNPALYDQALNVDEETVVPAYKQSTALSAAPPGMLGTPEEVIQYVEEKLGNVWEWSDNPANLVIVRKAGSGYKPGGYESPYDDLFLVVYKDKALRYDRGSAEGTTNWTYVSSYGYTNCKDLNTGIYQTPALAPGKYRFKVDSHLGKYKGLHIYDWNYNRTGLPSQRYNGKHCHWEVGGVNVHKGGSSWNWSVGCLTVHTSQYESFIGHYSWGKWGRVYLIGDWNGAFEPPSGVNLRPIELKQGGVNPSTGTHRVVATLKNDSNTTVSNFGVSVYIKDNQYMQRIESIGPDATLELSFDTDITQTGEYNFSVLVDNQAEIAETKEDDNKMTSKIMIQVVDSLNLTTTGLGSVTFDAGGSTVNAVVINNGNLDAGPFGISVWINGGHFIANLDGLAAGEQLIVPLATDISTVGVYNYSVLVDRTGLIDEVNENDNKVEALITVTDDSVQLTVEHPERVVVAKPVTFRGLAHGVRSVRVSVDNWIVYQDQITGSGYQFAYFFYATGKDRHVEVAGLDENGGLLATATSRIQVTEADTLEIVAPLSGETLPNPVTFRIDASPDIAKVVYWADGKWDFAKSTDAESQFKITYKFLTPGSRAILVQGLDVADNEVATDEITITVLESTTSSI